MSDREGGEEDVGLPKATVFKLINGASCTGCWGEDMRTGGHRLMPEMLPADLGCSKEAKEVIVECCVGECCSLARQEGVWRLDRVSACVELPSEPLLDDDRRRRIAVTAVRSETDPRMGQAHLGASKRRLRREFKEDNLPRTRRGGAQGGFIPLPKPRGQFLTRATRFRRLHLRGRRVE